LILLLTSESNHADVFNSNSLDDGIGQELNQGLSWVMQFSTKRNKEDMAQPITPIPKCEDSRIKVEFKGFQTYTVCPPSSYHKSIYINGIHNTIFRKKLILVPVQQGGKSSWNRPTYPNIKLDFEWFKTYKLSTPSSNHRSIYINGIHNTILGLNSIHVPVQQGVKSSWNRPTDPNIKVDFKRFQTYKLFPPSSNHRYININVIDNTILGLNSIHVPVQHTNKSLYCLQQTSLLKSMLCMY
jgi:hypothetical protein